MGRTAPAVPIPARAAVSQFSNQQVEGDGSHKQGAAGATAVARSDDTLRATETTRLDRQQGAGADTATANERRQDSRRALRRDLWPLWFGLVWNAITADNPPLLLTPADVDGDWPFVADVVRVSCCQDGHIGIVADNGQYYWFAGARHTYRFPVTALGRPGAPWTTLVRRTSQQERVTRA